MASDLIVVTGDKALDAKLKSLAPKLQRKFIRGALRRSAKRLEREFKRIVGEEAYDTGAFYGSVKIRALKRSRTRIGIGLYVEREKYFQEYAKRHGGKPPHPAAGETDPFYVVSVIEFGDQTHPPVRPQRRALYDNQDAYIAEFRKDLRQFIAEQKVTSALPKE